MLKLIAYSTAVWNYWKQKKKKPHRKQFNSMIKKRGNMFKSSAQLELEKFTFYQSKIGQMSMVKSNRSYSKYTDCKKSQQWNSV